MNLTELKKNMQSRRWRLNHLYYIQDENGEEVLFKLNAAQQKLFTEMHTFNVVPKARQLGFSTFISIYILDTVLFRPNTTAGIIDWSLDDAKGKLSKIKYAYNRLPDAIKNNITLTTENTAEIVLSNDSKVMVGTSLRGGTCQLLHVSEMGKIAANAPEKAREIITGGFGTVHPGGVIFVESTAAGAHGSFYDLVQQARQDQESGRDLTELDFKLHFFPWHAHPAYREYSQRPIPKDLQTYFDELDVELDDDQKSWYANKRRSLGIDDCYREYPSTLDEAFNASIQGSYFATQMSKMREDHRLGIVRYNPALPVNTSWDIGVSDATCIWFSQPSAAGSHAMIDYYEAEGEGVDHYVRILNEKASAGEWTYGTHYLPHDAAARNWASPGADPIVETMRKLGIPTVVVPRVQNKQDAIEAARALLNRVAIDEEHCDQGVKCLDSYRKSWMESRGTFSDKPLHDWASHGADSFMTLATGYHDRRPRSGPRKRAQLGTIA